MDFRTKINIDKESNPIDYDSNIVLFGSCFVENMEKHLNYFKFQNTSNSHGILFHPKAIEKAVLECVNNTVYKKTDLFYHNEFWLSFNHHSKFSSLSSNEILTTVNSDINKTHKALNTASHVLITLGTAWVYQFEEKKILVANCHKIPQKKFKKELLSIAQITESLGKIISLIKQVNLNATILFTVSPIRHLKDGIVENTLSKAHLISAIHQIVDKKNTFYFPSYEIMMDDLRDYRFYKNDMLHPNKTATNYIWEIFKKTWINEKSYPLMKEINSIQKSLQHRPFRKDSKKHQLFLQQLMNKIELITSKNPHIKFKKKEV